MATHSSILAWRIPGMGEPGGLPSLGSHRVRHDWRDLAAAAAVLGTLLIWREIGKFRTSLLAQTVKRLPTTWETWVWSLGWEDPLEKEMATHSRTVAWKIPWTEEPGRLQSRELQRATSLSLSFREVWAYCKTWDKNRNEGAELKGRKEPWRQEVRGEVKTNLIYR